MDLERVKNILGAIKEDTQIFNEEIAKQVEEIEKEVEILKEGYFNATMG